MKKIAVIGAGISGLSVANNLRKIGHDVVVYEKESTPGGLVRCTVEKGVLYHRVGGHVFNSKIQPVLDWFNSKFDVSTDFIEAKRDAQITWDFNDYVKYPIENNIRGLSPKLQDSIVTELLSLKSTNLDSASNLEDYLYNTFGKTLYNLYFKPYNSKLWSVPISEISTSWLKGKLPTPKLKDIILSNISGREEDSMVHSSFLYPKKGGSQFIVDQMANELEIKYKRIDKIEFLDNKPFLDDTVYDEVIFTGNVREAIKWGLFDIDITDIRDELLSSLTFNSTSNVLCTMEKNMDYSWLYLPSADFLFHRMIFTGNFSKHNNVKENQLSCTVEFAGLIPENRMIEEVNKLPFKVDILSSHREKYTYPVNTQNTEMLMIMVRERLKKKNIHLLGRFAEWKYYNMDTAIHAGMELSKTL